MQIHILIFHLDGRTESVSHELAGFVSATIILKLIQIQDGIDAKENVREWLSSSDVDHRDKLLACGALIVAELRMQVLKETEFTCSAGIAHNKVGSSPHFYYVILRSIIPH